MAKPLTIGVANPKGGVGKTTIAIHLAVAIHRAGTGVTLLDDDPQGSVLEWDRRTPDEYDGPAVDRVGADRTLAAAIMQTETSVTIVDSSARLDESTERVLSMSDLVLIPVRPPGLDLWGSGEFLGLLERHAQEEDLTAAFIRSQADPRTSLPERPTEAMEKLGLPLLDGFTSRVSYARALSEGQTVLDGYDQSAAKEVRSLLAEVSDLSF